MEKNRGRVERRTLTTTTVGTDTCDWPGVRQFLKLERTTTVRGETTTTVGYAITSHPPETASADELLQLWRDRWAIENRVFSVKDAVMREDHCRIRTNHAAACMSVIRNAILNYFRSCATTSFAAGLRTNVLQLDLLLSKLGFFIL